MLLTGGNGVHGDHADEGEAAGNVQSLDPTGGNILRGDVRTGPRRSLPGNFFGVDFPPGSERLMDGHRHSYRMGKPRRAH